MIRSIGWLRKKLLPLLTPALAAIPVLLLVGWPLGMVLHAAWQTRGAAEPGLTAVEQRGGLALETLALVALTLVVAVPLGVATALAISRTDLRARWWWALGCT